MGRRLRDVGVDVALAPVVDVNADPRNPVIGVRSFGATPDLVARHGAAFVRGLQAAGVAACAKHFPGPRLDPHRLPPRRCRPSTTPSRCSASATSRRSPPWSRPGRACIMTAHVVFPAYDDRPATLSPVLLGLLRGELGFDGVVDHRRARHEGDRGHGRPRRGRRPVDRRGSGPDLHRQPGVPGELRRRPAARRRGRRAGGGGPRRPSRLPTASSRRPSACHGCGPGWPTTSRAGSSPRGATSGWTRRAVVDLGGAVNIAAGDRERHLRELLERRSGDGRTVVLARYPDQLPEVSRLVAEQPDAVVVWSGIDVDVPGDNVVLTHGGGRAVAEAAAAADPRGGPMTPAVTAWSPASTSARRPAASAPRAWTATPSAPPRSPALGGWRTPAVPMRPAPRSRPGWQRLRPPGADIDVLVRRRRRRARRPAPASSDRLAGLRPARSWCSPPTRSPRTPAPSRVAPERWSRSAPEPWPSAWRPPG